MAKYTATILTIEFGEQRRTVHGSSLRVALREAARLADVGRVGRVGEAVSIKVERVS